MLGVVTIFPLFISTPMCIVVLRNSKDKSARRRAVFGLVMTAAMVVLVIFVVLVLSGVLLKP